MNCARCGAAAAEGAKFCMNCGAALQISCVACNQNLPPDAKFCFRCGHPVGAPAPQLATAPHEPAGAVASSAADLERLRQYIPPELLARLESSGRMRGERRVVTMLFCDVKGATAAAERLDPEDWAEIMNGAFGCLIPPVYRYEGTLARLMGDAILAFFGAPIAHEDDPERAVLAGLDILAEIAPFRERIRARWGLDFDVRVGINTGLVVVGEVGSDLRVEYTALGDAINLAARMEQTAQPGTVQITENTHRLISPIFETEDIGEIEVKGKAEPVRAFRVLARRVERGSLRGIAGLESPMVGRQEQLDLLSGRVDELAAGRGGIISIMGEAGLGKSRLVSELRNLLGGPALLVPLDEALSNHGQQLGPECVSAPGGAPILRYEGRSLSYQTGMQYATFVEMVCGLLGLNVLEADDEAYPVLKRRLTVALGEPGTTLAPFIGALLGAGPTGDDADYVKFLEPPQLRQALFGAVLELFEQVAERRPLLLVFEDLHWADPTSLDLLEKVMALTERCPLLILLVARPERQEPSWRIHEIAQREYGDRYASIMLQPLDEAGSRELVVNLLEVEDLPERVRAMILAKAEGNPFYVEEVIRSLLDARLVVREGDHWRATREIESINVPNTLLGVITARLDRLDPDVRGVAQTAAVIGREFEAELLTEIEGGRVLDEPLAELTRRELVRQWGRGLTHAYLFKHAKADSPSPSASKTCPSTQSIAGRTC